MKREIAVVGGGLTGFAAALGFAKAGFDTVLLAPPAAADARTSALIGPSVDFLEEIGVWHRLGAKAQPLTTMRIVDDTNRLFRAPTVEFRASEIGEASFGSNVPNVALQEAMAEAHDTVRDRLTVVQEGLATLAVTDDEAILHTGSGNEIRACLVVGADGRGSRVRESSGIGLRTWRYPQSAAVLNFAHAMDHGSVSTEFHTRNGPFTQVPLPGRRSSLVWVDEPRVTELLADLRPERLSRMVEDRLHSILGEVEVEPGVQVFPLSAGQADRLSAPRVLLIGEAAHFVPPIGAQGLNLGLRDAIAAIKAVEQARDDPGSDAVRRGFEAARRFDVASRSYGVDLLNRSLLADLLPMQLLRTSGLAALSSLTPLRRFAMREGVRPGSGLRSLWPDRPKPAPRKGDTRHP